MTIYPASRPQRKSIPRNALTGATIFVTAPGGVVFSIDPQFTTTCAERLARFIPDWALSYVAAGDYWIVTARYAETARWVLLITCGTMLRLWAPSYPAALGRLARHGRVEATQRQSDRGVA